VIATFLGTGRMKPGPGTWASVATVLAWAACAWWIPISYRTLAALFLSVLVIAMAVPAATAEARAAGRKDPQWVVIDETAGQLIALIGVPLAWKTFLASLILFRVFDILKPPPVRQLERLPEGLGIVMDDVAAGLYALAIMHLLMWFGLLRG
jgi:phosphatidylglycerophosphatase A